MRASTILRFKLNVCIATNTSQRPLLIMADLKKMIFHFVYYIISCSSSLAMSVTIHSSKCIIFMVIRLSLIYVDRTGTKVFNSGKHKHETTFDRAALLAVVAVALLAPPAAARFQWELPQRPFINWHFIREHALKRSVVFLLATQIFLQGSADS